ncbi:MAG: hypothetical protein R3250_16085, partial [Melioribacteraceae bacterium]|nr:hypothetical protein [Melioribacteraceae bacterium]
MKYIIIFICTAICFFNACQNGSALRIAPQGEQIYENRFFAMDLTSDDFILEEFTNQFFTTFPHDDPTLGDVVYDRSKWIHDDIIVVKKRDGLYSYVKFRNDSLGFDSFRYTTKSYYNLNDNIKKILFVFKGKLPSAKGMWPAWWLNGSYEDSWTYRDSIPAINDKLLNRYSGVGTYYDTPSPVNVTDWPGGGEIDIIENINGEKLVHNTIHTCPQMCDSEWNDDGIIINCANAKPSDVNPGCSGKKYTIEKLEGTFACLWEEESIKFFYWDSNENVKAEGGPLSSLPKPELWGDNYLKNNVRLMNTDALCNDAIHQSWQCENCSERDKCKFQNIKMIFNVTLCGVWAGNEFDSTENSLDNCKDYITGEG